MRLPKQTLTLTRALGAGEVQACVRHEVLLAVGEEEVVVEQRATLLEQLLRHLEVAVRVERLVEESTGVNIGTGRERVSSH